MVLFLYADAMVDGLQKGLGQQLHLVRYNSFTNVIDVLGLWLLLPRWGIAGYLFTYCLSHLVNFFLSLRRLLTVTEKPELCGTE
jgi:O-antigen/teichoic acid export membrane protein